MAWNSIYPNCRENQTFICSWFILETGPNFLPLSFVCLISYFNKKQPCSLFDFCFNLLLLQTQHFHVYLLSISTALIPSVQQVHVITTALLFWVCLNIRKKNPIAFINKLLQFLHWVPKWNSILSTQIFQIKSLSEGTTLPDIEWLPKWLSLVEKHQQQGRHGWN